MASTMKHPAAWEPKEKASAASGAVPSGAVLLQCQPGLRDPGMLHSANI